MIRATLLVAVASLAQAAAAIHWDELPKALKGQTIDVVTTQGARYHGRFAGTRADTLLVKEGHTVEIARESIVSIRRAYRIRGKRLNQFGECLVEAAGFEVSLLLSPFLPLAVAALPVTGAIGLAGLPILAVWDTFDRPRREEDVVILRDPAQL